MVVKELFAKLGLDFEGGGFSRAEAAISGLKWSLAGVGAALGGMAVGLGVSIKATADAGNAAGDLAARAGASVEGLQALGYAAKFSGASVDDVAVALQRLAVSGVKDVEGEFARLADRFASMPDGAEKVRLATATFGKSGEKLIPLLNKGSAGLAQFRQEAEDLGVIMSAETAAAGAEMNDAVGRISEALIGLRNQAMAPLVPMVRDVADRITAWVRANRELIKTRIDQAVVVVTVAARALWVVLSAVARIVNTLIEHWKLLAIILGSVVLAAIMANAAALWTLVAGYVAAGAAAVASGLAAAAAWLLAVWPVALIALGIAALLLILEDLYQFLTGGESVIGDLVAAWGDDFKAFFSGMWEDIKALGGRVFDFFAGVGAAIKDAVVGAVRWYAGLYVKIWEGIKALGGKVFEFYSSAFSWIGDKIRAFVDTIMGPIKWVLEKIGLVKKETKGAMADAARLGAPSGLPASAMDFDPAARMGGGSSPEASAAVSVAGRAPIVAAPQFSMGEITINAQPGQDAQEIAGAVRDQFEDWYSSKMGETMAAVGA